MESEVTGAPLMAAGSGSAGTLVLERPGVVHDASGTAPGPPGRSGAAPSVLPSPTPVDGGPEDARFGQKSSDPRIWEVLAAWRAAIRAIATTEPDTSAWYARHAELVGLRALYHALFDEVAAGALPQRRMVLVGRPRTDGNEGAVVVEDPSAGGAPTHDPGA